MTNPTWHGLPLLPYDPFKRQAGPTSTCAWPSEAHLSPTRSCFSLLSPGNRLDDATRLATVVIVRTARHFGEWKLLNLG